MAFTVLAQLGWDHFSQNFLACGKPGWGCSQKTFAWALEGGGEAPGPAGSPCWHRAVSVYFLSFEIIYRFLSVHWKDWCWSWSSNTLATWCEELTHLKRPWCWERLKAGGEGDDRGWDGWMASPTQWTWVWVSSRSWWRTGRPGVLQSMGLQRVGHHWATELN